MSQYTSFKTSRTLAFSSRPAMFYGDVTRGQARPWRGSMTMHLACWANTFNVFLQCSVQMRVQAIYQASPPLIQTMLDSGEESDWPGSFALFEYQISVSWILGNVGVNKAEGKQSREVLHIDKFDGNDREEQNKTQNGILFIKITDLPS